MSYDVYRHLADALDRLPGRFPRTPSEAEIPLLRCLFTEDQARLGAAMGRDYEPAAAIAAAAGRSPDETAARLEEMAELGLVLARREGERPAYRLMQFLDGIVELNLGRCGAELAELYEAYMDAGGARLLMGNPAYARVLPAEGTVRSEWVLPYDDVRAILEHAGAIVLSDCFCRTERALTGAPCDFPLRVCLNLRGDEPHDEEKELITTEEALRILDLSEEAGLVHTVSNVRGGWDWICNCCSCCCEWLRGYTEWQIDTAVVRNYRATVNEATCTGCGDCLERCQVAALAVDAGVARVDAGVCIGCGLCVRACPADALALDRLPEAEITLPPVDREAWEEERLRSRVDSST